MGLSQREKDELELLELEETEANAASSAPPEAKQRAGLLETAARGGAQGLTYGLSDEMAGGLGALGEIATGMSSPKDALSLYEEYRNSYRKGDKQAAADNPKTALISELGGGLLAPGGMAAKGAKFGARAARSAAAGAANAYGKTEAETPDEIAKDMAIGGAFGLGGEILGTAGSRLIPTAEGTKALARDQAIKHLRPTPTVARSMGKNGLNDMAEEVLDSGAIKFGAKAGETAEGLNGLRTQAYGKMKKAVEDSGATVDPASVAKKIEEDVIGPLRGNPEYNDLVQSLEKRRDAFLETFPAGKEIPASQLEKVKSAAQEKANYKVDSTSKINSDKKYARALKESTEEALAGKPQLQPFQEGKKTYGAMKSAQKMAERTGGLSMGGTGLMGGLLDMGTGLEALHEAQKGNYKTAGLLGAARALTRGRVNSSSAAMLNTLAQALAKRGKTNEALKIAEGLIQQSSPVIARQHAPYEVSP